MISQIHLLQEELLERFFQESVMDLLIALAPHVSYEGRKGPLRNDNLLLLEIFFFTFKDQKPGDLLAAVAERGSGKVGCVPIMIALVA